MYRKSTHGRRHKTEYYREQQHNNIIIVIIFHSETSEDKSLNMLIEQNNTFVPIICVRESYGVVFSVFILFLKILKGTTTTTTNIILK